MEEFEKLVDEIISHRWRTSPVAATADGIHDYDHDLDRLDRDSLEEAHAARKGFLRRLNSPDVSKLSPSQDLERRVLTGALTASIAEFEQWRPWEKDPSIPSSIALYSVFLPMVRNYAPLEDRVRSIISRLEKFPRLFSEARKNIVNPPRVLSLIALDSARGGMAFLTQEIPALAQDVSSLKDALLKARDAALSSLGEYGDYLERNLLPRSRGSFAVGRELFDLKLREEHGLPYSSDDLLTIGEDALRETEKKITEAARAIGGSKGWKNIVADLKADHPAPEELLETYRREMMRARDFVRTNRLVDFPSDESLDVIPTPEFERPTTPYAAMMPPAPFEREQKSFFYVTTMYGSMPQGEKEERLKGHSTYSIPVTALHEAYPGHHLQYLIANRNPSRVFRLYGTPVFVEGWALYCEDMMYEEGFYTDPRVRLFQLKDILWRASRVIVDVGLHTQDMSYDEAVNVLVTRAGLEEPNARNEVNRYCQGPTYPMSYIIGKIEIMKLRDTIRKKMGSRFSLSEFHNWLLGFGNISPCLIAEYWDKEGKERKGEQ